MKKACRLTILLSTLLCAPAFAIAAPGYTDATESQTASASSEPGSCAQATHEGDPADGVSLACEDLSIESSGIADASDVGIVVLGPQPAVQRSTMVTPHTDDGRSTDDPVRPGYVPDGTPIYRLPTHGRHHARSPCNVSVPLPTGARARLTC